MSTPKTLLESVIAKDPIAFNEAFQSIISEKIVDALEERKIEIARALYSNEEADVVSEDVEDLGEEIDTEIDLDELDEAVDPVAAREFLEKHGLRNKNFFSLNTDQVGKIVDHGKQSKYRKSSSAPGSYGRMYHGHLNRLADKADRMKAETAKKYGIKEELEKETIKHPVGQRPKGAGWVLKQAGEQTGKDHSVWERKVKRIGKPETE